MSLLSRWHPVLTSEKLRDEPVRAKLYGRELVLFRDESGEAGALADACPHRGMRLSEGRVEDGRLVCPYHGWCFDAAGEGASPGNPGLRARAETFQAEERQGWIFVKQGDEPHPLPELEFDGLHVVHRECSVLAAPVEALMDNFTEVEHTAKAHWIFGFDPALIAEVTNVTRAEEGCVKVEAAGPQKRVPWLFRIFLGIRPGDHFCISWRTELNPPRSIFDWWWRDPIAQKDRPCRFREVAYFLRRGDHEAGLSSQFYWTRKKTGLLGFNRLVTWVAKQIIRYEIHLDRVLIENVIYRDLDSEGTVLGRFDRALREHRRQLTWE
jgi:vanillate O-demethylase monooxygenase subunit